MSKPEYAVAPIDSKDTYPYLLEIHYAKRIPAIAYAFGLFCDGELVGVCTFGSPASSTLQKGLCGPAHADKVLELNRLCLKYNRPNEASILVGASLKRLPKPTVVVSFADTSHNHTGVVYQATNFIYTGLTVARTEWAVKGLEHLHSRALGHIAKKLEGDQKDLEKIKMLYGDRFYYRSRPRKHRYVAIMASKTDKRTLLKALKYEPQPYPNQNLTDLQVVG